MLNHTSIADISDGRPYGINEMVRADAGGCNGCSACCHDVGDLVSLTPYDVYELAKALNLDFNGLVEKHLSLQKSSGLRLPYLKMLGAEKKCTFLNAEQRCRVHDHRPNICRLFPLARVYTEDDYYYILQNNACVKPKLDKIKVKKWLSIDRYAEHKAFTLSWYQTLKALQFRRKFIKDSDAIEAFHAQVLQLFYTQQPAHDEDFFEYFMQKLPEAKKQLSIL